MDITEVQQHRLIITNSSTVQDGIVTNSSTIKYMYLSALTLKLVEVINI